MKISEGGAQVEQEADKDNKETEKEEDDGLIGLAAMGIDQEKKHKGKNDSEQLKKS